MDPIPLRTVRPFVMDEMVLAEVAEEEGFEVTDQSAIARTLKSRVFLLFPFCNPIAYLSCHYRYRN